MKLFVVTLAILTLTAAPARAAENFCEGADKTIASHTSAQPVAHHRGPWSHPEQVPGFVPLKIESYDDLLTAFRSGLIPDFNDKDQRAAFEIYRTSRFGDAGTELNADTWSSIAAIQKKHPDLTKEIFRNYQVTSTNKYYSVTPELEKFLNANAESNGLIRATLDTSKKNKNYWQNLGKKVTVRDAQGRPTGSTIERLLTDEQIEDIRQIEQSYGTSRSRDRALFKYLKTLRAEALQQGKDVKPLSQVLANIVHNAPFQEESIKAALKSPDGMKRLQAFRQALTDRVEFLQEVNFIVSYAEFIKVRGVSKATGMMDEASFAKQLARLQEGLESAGVQATETQQATIRQLSIAESPFRSCIGGTDCSSRTYLTKALDPNYHYFTWTDSEGYSSGHVTVVLGTSGEGPGATRVAFVDKIQNVPNEQLPQFLEGVRQSVAEKGYTLGIPGDLGNHNGISNVDSTTRFIAHELKSYTQQKQRLPAFKPHANPLSGEFRNEYSRAEKDLGVVPLLPMETAPGAVEIQAGAAVPNWSIAHIDVSSLIKQSIALKHGGLDDQLRYISSMESLTAAGQAGDPEFSTVVLGWAKGSSEVPVKLRNRAMIHFLRAEPKRISELLKALTFEERVNLVQNWWQTPSLQPIVRGWKRDILPLIKDTQLYNDVWMKTATSYDNIRMLLDKPVPGNRLLAELKDSARRDNSSLAVTMGVYADDHQMNFADVDAMKLFREWSDDIAAGRTTSLTQRLTTEAINHTAFANDVAAQIGAQLGPKAKRKVLAAGLAGYTHSSISIEDFQKLHYFALGDAESLDLLFRRPINFDSALDIGIEQVKRLQPGPEAAQYGAYFQALIRKFNLNLTYQPVLDKVLPLFEEHYPAEFKGVIQEVASTINQEFTAQYKENVLSDLMQREGAYVPELIADLVRGSDRDGIQHFQSVWMTEFRAKFPAQASALEDELAHLKPAVLVQRRLALELVPGKSYPPVFAGPDTLVDLTYENHSMLLGSYNTGEVNWISDSGVVKTYKSKDDLSQLVALPDGSVLTLARPKFGGKGYAILRLKDGKVIRKYPIPALHAGIELLGGDTLLLTDSPDYVAGIGLRIRPTLLNLKTGKVTQYGLSDVVLPLKDGSIFSLDLTSGSTVKWLKEGQPTESLPSSLHVDVHESNHAIEVSPKEVAVIRSGRDNFAEVQWYTRSGSEKTVQVEGNPRSNTLSRNANFPLHDGKTLFLQTVEDGSSDLYWLRDGKIAATLPGGNAANYGASLLLADDSIFVQTGPESCALVKEGKILAITKVGNVSAFALAPDGKTVLAVSNKSNLVWIRDGKIIRTVNTNITEDERLFIYPNGKALFTGRTQAGGKPTAYTFDAMGGLP